VAHDLWPFSLFLLFLHQIICRRHLVLGQTSWAGYGSANERTARRPAVLPLFSAVLVETPTVSEVTPQSEISFGTTRDEICVPEIISQKTFCQFASLAQFGALCRGCVLNHPFQPSLKTH
jgi:hypothetical protein